MNENENQGSETLNKKQSEIKLTVKEAAQQIGESPHVIRNWLRELKGHIDTIKGENNYHYFDDKAIERLLLIQKLSREQGYSLKQIKYFIATGEDPLKPEPKPENENQVLDELQEIKDHLKKLEEFNRALIERLDQQEKHIIESQKYINESINRRDRELLEEIDRRREQRIEENQKQAQLESAASTEQPEKKGFFARMFSPKN